MGRGLSLAALQAAAIAALVLALLGATGLAALHGGAVPQFRQIMAAGPRLALVIENGPFCVPDAPLAACNATVRQEFRIWLYAGNTTQTVIAYVWRE